MKDQQRSQIGKSLATALLIAGSVFAPEALAVDVTTLGVYKGLQAVIELLTGGIARSIAILAIMGFGVGGLTGRIDWIRALQVVLAIGVIFSAATLADLFVSTGS